MNKSSFLQFVFCLIVKASVAQTLDANGFPTAASAPGTLSTPSQLGISSLSFANSRRLTEINTAVDADAYPCLSPNGLRVYYTKGDYNIYAAVRNPLSNTFSSPVLCFDYTSNLFSCTISADEKTLIATTGSPSKLIRATRSNLNGSFNYQSEIQLDDSPNFFTSPSFSPDSSELYLYESSGISRYLRTGNNAYSYDSYLPSQLGIYNPGRLSADGLDFFNGITIGNVSKIYRWSRSSLSTTFTGTPQLVTIDGLAGSTPYFFQPTVSADNAFMIFAANNLNTWTDNDLAIAFNTTTETQKSLNNFSFTVFPNPSAGSFRATGFEAGLAYNLLNTIGQIVCTGNLPNDGTIDISTLASGIYTLRLLKNDSWVQEKVVKE